MSLMFFFTGGLQVFNTFVFQSVEQIYLQNVTKVCIFSHTITLSQLGFYIQYQKQWRSQAFPGKRATHPEDQNEEEIEENLRQKMRGTFISWVKRYLKSDSFIAMKFKEHRSSFCFCWFVCLFGFFLAQLILICTLHVLFLFIKK